jgi:signal peptidase I
VKLEPEIKSEPEVEPAPELKLEPKIKSEPEVEPAPELKLEPEIKSEPEVEPTPELKLEPEVTSVPKLKLEPHSAIESEDFSATDNSEAEYNERHPFLNALLHIGICVFVALILAFLITKFVAHHTSVEGSSMETTLTNNDQLIVENISYYLHDPERFDVIVFPYNDEVNYIKRIIGLPGETVQIRNGCIYINGELLDESYGRETIEDPGIAAEEIQLGDDEYFVLGDNRNASIDSRKEEVGLIKRSDIKGKAWLRFYPMDRVSLIE